MKGRRSWRLITQTFSAWSDHDAPRLGAAIAFYAILSIAPLVLIALAIAGSIFGSSRAEQHLVAQVESLIGHQGAEGVKAMIEQGAHTPRSGAFASIIGIATLLFGASGVFGELRAALNTMWDVKPGVENEVWGVIRQRFFSMGMVFAVGFLLLVSLLLSTVLTQLGNTFGASSAMPAAVAGALKLGTSLLGITVVFALIFRYVPDTTIPWKSIWLGASITALLFTIGKSLIGLYLGKAAVGSAYGAAGSLVVIVVWIYYSAMIFLFGAEFTHEVSSEAITGNGR